MIKKVAIIGGGVIGGGWAARVLLNGLDVYVYDSDPNKEYLETIKPKIEKKIKRKINFLISSTGTLQKGLVVFEN